MDGTMTAKWKDDTLLLTDSNGKRYLLARQVLASCLVPEEHRADVEAFVISDVEGYGDGNFLINGVLTHMGTKKGMKGFDSAFDLDGDGDTDWDDYYIAKKQWYDQYVNVPQPSNTPPKVG